MTKTRQRGLGRVTSVLLASALCLTVLTPPSAQTLNIDAARTLAFQLVSEGKFDSAAALAQTLLERDPEDQSALLALAQAERGAGRTKTAIKAAKAAWRASDTDAERYASATVAAQSYSTDKRPLLAQLWLRRAAQAAPDAELRQSAERNFKFVRDRNPLTVNLRFSVAPSNNINNGSSSLFSTINGLAFELTGENRALSGMSYRFGVSADYRFALSERQTLTFGISADSNQYSLSSQARAQAPSLRASDLEFNEIKLSARTRLLDADGKGSIGGGITLGQNWYGGNPLTRFVRVDANRQFAISDKAQAGFGISGTRNWRQDNALRNSTVWAVNANYAQALGNGDVVTLRGSLTDVVSAAASTAHDSVGVTVGYRFAKPVFANTSLELSLGAKRSSYDRPILLGPEPRADTKLSASATLVLKDLDYFGFSPTATLSGSRTKSNISAYESKNLGVSFGLRSSF